MGWIKGSRYWTHPPSPIQGVFLGATQREVLYGGAAGGGKTDALLMAALQYVDVPGYSALLLRRTYKQLTNAGQLLDLSRQWLGNTDAKWNDQEAKWSFPSGATIRFGHLDSDRDLEAYSGPTYQFIGFDELTQFPEQHYTFLFTRLRRTANVPVPLRMRAASNPGQSGHWWVKRRFVDLPRDQNRAYVPARIADNPALDQSYADLLRETQDPQNAAHLIDGDWNARPPGSWAFDGTAIDAALALGERLDRDPPPRVGPKASGVDFGDFATVGLPIHQLERGGIYVPGPLVATSRADLEDITREFVAMMAGPGWWEALRYDASFAQSARTVAGILERSIGRHNEIRRTGRPKMVPIAFGEYKDLTVRYLRLLLNRTLAGHATRVLAISPRNELLADQLRGMQVDDKDKLVKGDDDSVDALIAGVAPLAIRHRETAAQELAEARRNQPPNPLSLRPGQVA